MRVVIVGGTRFIGPEIVRQLLVRGHDVTVFHRGQTHDPRTDQARHIYGDRSQLPSFRADFRKIKPHIALDMLALNETDAGLFVETFHDIAPRLIAISSQDVYRGYGVLWNTEDGPPEPTPFTEDSPLRTSNRPHGDKHDKLAVEKLVMKQDGWAGTILRLPMVYGKGDRQHRLFEYLKRMDDDRPAILIDRLMHGWRWTRGYVDDVAAAVCLAIVSPEAAGRIYNVGQKTALSEGEWIEKIARCVRWPGKIVPLPRNYLPKHLQAEYNFRQDMAVDTSRIRNELGYRETVNFEEALIRTVEWERNHPPEKIDSKDFDYEAEDEARHAFEAAGA